MDPKRHNPSEAMTVSRRIALSFFLLILLGLGITLWPVLLKPAHQNPLDITLTGGPMVQRGNTDGQTSIAIVWRTAEMSTSRVDYGETPEAGSHVADPGLTTYHAVVLRDLRPSARYHYRVSSNNRVLAQAIFNTDKSAAQPFRFAVFGDSGSGKEPQHRVAEQLDRQNVDFILHTGDVVYPKGEDKLYRAQFYLPYQKLLERIPIFPVLGNHDYMTGDGQPWLDNFFLPGEERFYSFDYGNAHFVALDSNRIDPASAAWLDRDLAQTGKTWKVVFFHTPPFSNVDKDLRTGSAGARTLWVPLLVKYQVDLVFSGHDHLYTRFKQRQGTTYIVEGLGGRSRYRTNKNAGHVESTDNAEFGFGLVEVTGLKLVYRHITASGQTLDTFSLHKQKPVRRPVG